MSAYRSLKGQLFKSNPAMMVLPAPGSSASKKRSGWRGSMHFTVNRRDLMRQRFDLRGTNREIRVKQICEANAICLRRKPKKTAVSIKCVGASSFQELEAAFFTAIDESLANSAVNPEYEIQGIGAEAGNRYNLSDATGSRPRNLAPGLMLSKVCERNDPIIPPGLWLL